MNKFLDIRLYIICDVDYDDDGRFVTDSNFDLWIEMGKKRSTFIVGEKI